MIDLANWNITVPEAPAAITIPTKTLNAGYESKYFTRTGEAVTFWAPASGGIGGTSSYPRSELRETGMDGKTRNWYYASGSHFMMASLAVTQVPPSGKVIIGQIHAKEVSGPFLKFLYRKYGDVGYVTVELRQKPTDTKSPVVLAFKDMPLGKAFDYSVAVSPKGELAVSVNGMVYNTRIDASWADKQMYFKAGMYSIDNSGSEVEGGRAVFYKLNMGHAPQ